MEIALAIPFGFAIGLVVGTIGGGGAILALPVFVYVLGQDAGPATTASLIVVALGASFGAGTQARYGNVCWRIALTFSAPAAIGAYAGTVAGAEVGEETLLLAFVPVMLAAAAVTYTRGAPDEQRSHAGCPAVVRTPAIASGLTVGVMTGFFGVGGGFLIVPALTLILGLGMVRAIATSLAIITLTGLAALGSHLVEGSEPDWTLTLIVCAAAAAGAVAGTSLGRRLPAQALAHAFGIVVGLIALLLLADILILGASVGS